MVYAYTPSCEVIALDGATGREIWKFDSGMPGRGAQRGLTWWSDGQQKRLFASVMHYLYALDPATGKPLPDFGDGGRIDLRQNMSRDSSNLYVSLTTPGVIYKDMIITGFRTAESAPAAPGDIRAFDVRSGKLRWSFRTIPRPGDEGHNTWPSDAWKSAGGANNWTGMVVDQKRGIVYAPTGSAVDDFYGADRLGDNLFANSLLALDANTGRRLWHFQGVHHDINDRDFLAARAADLAPQRQTDRCCRAAQQARLSVRAGPRDRQAAVPDSGNTRTRLGCTGRDRITNPAGSVRARALRPPASERRHAHHAHTGSACLGADAVPQFPQRRSFRADAAWPADPFVSRFRRRRGLGRARPPIPARHHLYQFQ